MKLAWLTDIHLNFLDPPEVAVFVEALARTEADAFLLGGDTGEAHNVVSFLEQIAARLQKPVYFVLGNHDFYRAGFASVRSKVEVLQPPLCWLSRTGVVPLTEKTCLIGADGWGDGRYGDYWGSTVQLNDWVYIEELTGPDEHERLAKLQALGDEAAAHLRAVMPEALKFERVIVLTHVPPFREACWHRGRISNDHYLPHFACKAVGDLLVEAMKGHKDRQMTVLCGHTHGEGEAQILPNLKVFTGGAEYGEPTVQRVWEVP